MKNSDFNPYQAPVAASDQASLAPDTEFLVERESQLRWCSRWITAGRLIAIFAATFFAIPMLIHLPQTSPGFSSWSEIEAFLQLAGSAVIILALIAFVAASYIFAD